MAALITFGTRIQIHNSQKLLLEVVLFVCFMVREYAKRWFLDAQDAFACIPENRKLIKKENLSTIWSFKRVKKKYILRLPLSFIFLTYTLKNSNSTSYVLIMLIYLFRFIILILGERCFETELIRWPTNRFRFENQTNAFVYVGENGPFSDTLLTETSVFQNITLQ